jgi:hypothetical protein
MSAQVKSWRLHTRTEHKIGEIARAVHNVMFIIDETANEKSLADCAGAARRYSGVVGGTRCARSRSR